MKRLLQLGLLLLFQVAAMAQTRQLSGTVKDSKTGLALGSATVQVQGKSARAITNENGEFTLIVPSGAVTLQISYVGYGTKTMSVAADATSADVVLDQESTQATEVVVTALGITKNEKKVGYSVSTVNGNQLNQAREVNVANSLTGQVAGLNVHATSGGPGSTARILLRGMPSITGAGSPLFVLNGVPIDNGNRGTSGEWGGADAGDGIGNINPDDIETMTVLKGQAASALYGTRATNGVILITTKTGKKGSASVEYNTNYVLDRAVDNTDYQYQYGQGTGGAKPATAAASRGTGRFSWGEAIGDGSQSVIGYNGAQYKYAPVKAGTNLHDFYRNGPSWTNTVSVTGGGENGNYRLSASTLDNSSIVRNSGVHRKTVNFTMNQNISPKLNLAMLANYIDQQDILRPSTSDGPGNPNNFALLANTVDVNRFKPGYDTTTGHEIVFSDDNYVTNPWFVVNQWKYNTARKRIITSITPKYNFNDWIYALVRFGYDSENDRAVNITPTGTDYSYNSAGQSGSYSLTNQTNTNMNIDGLLNIKHDIVKDISFDATLGGSFRKDHFENQNIGGGPYVIPYLYTPTNVVSFNRSYAIRNKQVSSGFYSVDFSYSNFLTLSTTGRFDQYSSVYNSQIPKSQRGIFTPSVSASFIFSELLHSSVLNYGKLRGSYAKTSGEPSLPYQTAIYYNVGSSLNGVPTGNYNDALANLFLKPFTKSEVEVGLEARFLNSRLGIDVTYYHQKTDKEILNGNLSWATGYNAHLVATGSTQNNGLELQITGSPVKTQFFAWNVTFNFTSVQSKILKTDEAGNDLGQGAYRPLNAVTAFRKGLAGPQILANDYTYDSTKGNAIVVDADGLPIAGNRIAMGSVLPKYYGGLRNDFMIGSFNVSFLIDYNYGNKILSATQDYTTYYGLNKGTLEGRVGGVHVVGVTADGTASDKLVDAQAYYQRKASISKFNVLSGDYIKLRQVTFGYTFNEKMLAKVPVFSSINVSLVARNLWTIMKKSDNIDPESAFRGDVQYAGIEGTSLPATRTFGFNVNLKFKK